MLTEYSFQNLFEHLPEHFSGFEHKEKQARKDELAISRVGRAKQDLALNFAYHSIASGDRAFSICSEQSDHIAASTIARCNFIYDRDLLMSGSD